MKRIEKLVEYGNSQREVTYLLKPDMSYRKTLFVLNQKNFRVNRSEMSWMKIS